MKNSINILHLGQQQPLLPLQLRGAAKTFMCSVDDNWG